MALKVTVTRDVDVTIMEMVGTVTLGVGSITYRDAIREAIWNGHRKFAVDYSQISYQDSSGNGEMVSAFTVVRNCGGELVFFDLTKRIQDMFQITKLNKCFRTFDSKASAQAYFESTRSIETRVSEDRYSDISILAIEGSLREGSNSSQVLSATQAALDSGAESVVLLCRQMLDIDSKGAEIIIEASRRVRERGGKLVLAGVEGRLHGALRNEGILNDFYAATDEALKALKKTEVDRNRRRLQVMRAD